MGFSDSNKSYADDQSAVADILNGEGVQGSLTVGTSAVEVKVGASRLADRKSVTLYNNSNRVMYWGYTSGVTVSSGTPILRDQLMEWTLGQDRPIYVVTDTAGNNARITEAS